MGGVFEDTKFRHYFSTLAGWIGVLVRLYAESPQSSLGRGGRGVGVTVLRVNPKEKSSKTNVKRGKKRMNPWLHRRQEEGESSGTRSHTGGGSVRGGAVGVWRGGGAWVCVWFVCPGLVVHRWSQKLGR